MIIRLHLPLPPSLNSLYPGKVRRHKSREYKAWIIQAGYMLNAQHKTPCIDVPVFAYYRVGKPSNRQMDLVNREKAVSDLLVHHGVIKDDSLIHKILMEWAPIDGVDIELSPL